MRGDGGLGGGLWWTRARGAGRVPQQAAHVALLSQHGHACGAGG